MQKTYSESVKQLKTLRKKSDQTEKELNQTREWLREAKDYI